MARLDARRLKQVRDVFFALELQSELLVDIDTVAVAPLLPADALPPIAEVNPIVDVRGEQLAVRVEQLVSLPRARLGDVAGNLLADEYRIMRALDRLLSRT